MEQRDLLSRAVREAGRWHGGQKDKAGAPYILHPLRVMMRFQNEDEQIVAVLHDVFEDTNASLDWVIGYGYPQSVIDALVAITRQKNEEYFAYIQRVSQNRLATLVKMEDLQDNMDRRRLPNPSAVDAERWVKYQHAYDILFAVIFSNGWSLNR